MAHHLPNYIRTYRKRGGLTQEEVAFLFGNASSANVSRYERFGQQPTLTTGLGCEVIFGIPAATVFAGTFVEVEDLIAQRARFLAARLAKHQGQKGVEQKLMLLDGILARHGRASIEI